MSRVMFETSSERESPALGDPVDREPTPLSGQEYRLLVEHSPVLIWRSGRDKKCDYFNQVWLDFTGRTMEQEMGDGWAEGVHPDDLERCIEIYSSHFDRRVPFEMEYRLRRHDGLYRWIFDRGVPFTGDGGEFKGYIGSCVDVTERRDAEERARDLAAEQAAHEALRKSEARERFLAHVSQVMSAHLDYANSLDALMNLMVPAIADVSFFDAVEGEGLRRRAWKHVDPSREAWMAGQFAAGVLDPANHPAAHVLRSGAPEFVEQVDEGWIQRTATSPAHEQFLRELGLRSLMRVPVQDGNRPIGVLTLAITSSERQYTDADRNLGITVAGRLTATLRNARLYSELQHALRVRDDVTSIVSHDLRNPVHTVMMAASLLLDLDATLDAPTRLQSLTVIHRSATNMSRLLQDLLDVMKAEGSGGLVIEVAPTDIAAILRGTVEEFRLQAANMGIDLSAEIPPSVPLVLADAGRVAQVLSNLCGNALKFTRRGGQVRLSAEHVESAVTIAVEDTGVGIAPDDLTHVFDRFWQARRASRASAGLGLAIAKNIVEAHGSRIVVRSVQGEGTRFHFALRVAGGAADPGAQAT